MHLDMLHILIRQRRHRAVHITTMELDVITWSFNKRVTDSLYDNNSLFQTNTFNFPGLDNRYPPWKPTYV